MGKKQKNTKKDNGLTKGLQQKKEKKVEKTKIDWKMLLSLGLLAAGIVCFALSFVWHIGEGYLSIIGIGLACCGFMVHS